MLRIVTAAIPLLTLCIACTQVAPRLAHGATGAAAQASAATVGQGTPAAAGAAPLTASCEAFARLENRPPAASSTPMDFGPGLLRLQKHFRRAEALGFSGGVTIGQDGRTLLREAYGFADKDRGRPMQPDTVFDIGSVAKQFTAAAILRLEETGRLEVTDSISRFFPEAPADKRAITIHQLLTHTGGLPHDAARRDELLSREEGVARILAVPLRSPPGKQYQYSNAGFTLLAAIVELASEQDYERFLRDELWLPAGMKNTGNLDPAWRQDQFALGYNAAGSSAMPPRQWWVADGPSWSVRGAGYILSTADDLIRWAGALRSGAVLTDASRRKLFHPHVRENSRQPSYYGYGWAISEAPDGTCVIAHDGGAGFHADVIRMYPAHDLAAVFFTSESRSPVLTYMEAAAPLLFRPGKMELPEAQVVLGQRDLQQLAGSYRVEGIGTVAVTPTGSSLTVRSKNPGVLRSFSAFPELSAADQALASSLVPKVTGLFKTLHQGDYSQLEPLLPEDVTLQEEQAFWPAQWQAWARDMGGYRGVDVIGHRRAGEALVTYVHMQFARSALPIELIHRPNGKVYINTVTMLFPERSTLLPRRDGSFLVYNPNPSSGVIVELDPASRLLEVRAQCFGVGGCQDGAVSR